MDIMDIPPGYYCTTCAHVHSTTGFVGVSMIDVEGSRSTCKFCQFIFDILQTNHPTANLIHFDQLGFYIDPCSMTLEYLPVDGSGRRTLRFHADCGQEKRLNPWPILPSSPKIPENIFADSCWNQAGEWIDNCLANHGFCPQNHQSIIPRRCLRITTVGACSENNAPSVRLYENNTNQMARYVALSHVWMASMPGSSQTDVMTVKANLNSRLGGNPLNDLPKTFQDAIHICAKLGVEFLWIDALCIIQDDDQDWETEASRMGKYYRNAYITIAAHPTHTMSGKMDPDADRGCHLVRPPEFKTTVHGPDDQPFVISSHLVLHDKFFPEFPDESHNSYFLRGWCFQERMLAPRILHFMRSEVIFECNADKLECECGRINIGEKNYDRRILIKASSKKSVKALVTRVLEDAKKPPNQREPNYQDVALNAYRYLITGYTEKHLTKPTDLLPALSSVASLLAPSLGRYYAGIWEYGLYQSLCWGPDWVYSDHHRHPIDTYVAPSFSWASQRGSVVILNIFNDWKYAEILNIQCQSLSPSAPFGEVVDGSLTLLARSISVTVHSGIESLGRMMTSAEIIKTQESCFTLDTAEDQFLAEGKPVIYIELREREKEVTPHRLQPLVRIEAIVAVPSDRRLGAFERIGFARYERLAIDLPRSEFVIV